MRTYGSDVRHARTLGLIVQDGLEILRQDAAEYGFIAFVGAFPACIGLVILRVIDNPLASALIAPLVIAMAVLTMATSTEAFRRVVDNLEPDAVRSFLTVIPRIDALLTPWLPLMGGLAAAGFAASLVGGTAGGLTGTGIVFASLVLSAFYALPRSFVCVALFTQRSTSRQASSGSAALVWRSPSKIATGWAIALGPAIAVALLALMSGMGTASSAIATLIFVGSMPALAVMMSLLFFDALLREDEAPGRRVTVVSREAQ
jgi:hypothetical protein